MGLRVALPLLLACAAALAQDAPSEVRRVLALDGSTTSFRIGEPIRLTLSFSGPPQQYQVNSTEYPASQSMDEILVSPAQGYTKVQQPGYGADYAVMTLLSDQAVTVRLTLNDYYRFDRPGHYTVQVRTPRLQLGTELSQLKPGPKLLTNLVYFDIVPMTAEEEAAQLARIDAVLANRGAKTEDRKQALSELSYLTGEATIPEKIRRVLHNEIPESALLMSVNRQLVQALLQQEFQNPEKPVNATLISALALVDGAPDARSRYLKELAASLPSRPAAARIVSAETVVQLQPDPAAFDVLRQNLASLPLDTIEYLFRMHKQEFERPELAPAIDNILATGKFASGDYQARGELIAALTDLAPERARTYVVDEIRRPSSLVSAAVLARLPDPELPEVDTPLLEAIQKLGLSTAPRDGIYLDQKTRLAARYASAAILPGLTAAFEKDSAHWPPNSVANILAYFAKQIGDKAGPLLEHELETGRGAQNIIFLNIIADAAYSPAVARIAKSRLASEDVQVASGAAFVLGNHGSAEDAALLQALLQKGPPQQLRGEITTALQNLQRRFQH